MFCTGGSCTCATGTNSSPSINLCPHAEALMRVVDGLKVTLPSLSAKHAYLFRYTKIRLQLEVGTCRMSRGDLTSSVNLVRTALLELSTLPRDAIRDAVALEAVSGHHRRPQYRRVGHGHRSPVRCHGRARIDQLSSGSGRELRPPRLRKGLPREVVSQPAGGVSKRIQRSRRS